MDIPSTATSGLCSRPRDWFLNWWRHSGWFSHRSESGLRVFSSDSCSRDRSSRLRQLDRKRKVRVPATIAPQKL